MNDQANPYAAVIADLRTKRDQIDQLIKALEAFADPAGAMNIGSLAIPPVGIAVGGAGGGVAAGNTMDIAPGTFHGMGIQEAVRKLLLLRKRTMSAPELATDLRAGGLDFAPKSIASVLHRSFAAGGDVVRRDRGQWGLREWYPNQRFNP